MLLELVLATVLATADTLTFTMPDSVPQQGTCDTLVMPELGPLSVRLERLRHDEFDWQVVDSLVGLQPGQPAAMHLDLTGCRPCAYRLWVVDQAGNVSVCPSRAVNRWELGEPVGVGDKPSFHLGRVTPMPIRRLAVVEFQLAREGEAVLELFDLSGRRVRTLTSGAQPAGHHLALLDAGQLPAGLYLLRLRAGERQALRRVVVMR